MSDWRTGGSLDRVRAEAAMDRHVGAPPSLEDESRADDARDALRDSWLAKVGEPRRQRSDARTVKEAS